MSSQDSADYYRAYEHYTGLLRTWLVAYGIGGPVVILTNESLWTLLRRSGESRAIAIFFLTGVALQVALATINKVLMWISYYETHHAGFNKTRRFKAVKWLRGQFWIDVLADVISLALFTAATYKVFIVITG